MIVSGATIGTLMMLMKPIPGVPMGTLGIVDEVKRNRITVRWYLPNSSGRNLSLRDGFDKKRMLQYLEQVPVGKLLDIEDGGPCTTVTSTTRGLATS